MWNWKWSKSSKIWWRGEGGVLARWGLTPWRQLSSPVVVRVHPKTYLLVRDQESGKIRWRGEGGVLDRWGLVPWRHGSSPEVVRVPSKKIAIVINYVTTVPKKLYYRIMI
jgi:hypothetical protein